MIRIPLKICRLVAVVAAVLLASGLASVTRAHAQEFAEGADEAADGAADGPGVLGLAVGIDALRWQGGLDLNAEFADYRRLGVRWLRTDLNWGIVQAAGPDSFDWQVMDAVVDLARAQGIEVLPVVGGFPAWAGDDASKLDPARFAAFVTAAVERYEPRGVRVWEVWNEPNLGSFWPPVPNPVAYARVLAASHAAIKAVDPEALVLSGGLSPAASTDFGAATPHMSAIDFLETVYAAGARAHFDALAFHPYSWPRLPTSAAPWTGWNLMVGPIRALMDRYGDGGKRVWITEFGAPTGGDPEVNEQGQVEMLEAAVRLARGYPWAGPLFWYSYRDLGDDPADTEDWFGLVRRPGEPKPAFADFEALSKQ